MFVNGIKLKVIQPLDPNVSTKFRKDEKVEMDIDETRILHEPSIELYISFENIYDEYGKNSKKGDKPVHYVSLMLAQRLVSNKLLEDVVKQNSISENQSLDLIKAHFEGSQIVEPFIKLSTKCPLTQEPIKFPARAEACLHVQPFCLKSFLISIEKSRPRNYACPICKMPCHRLLHDKFLRAKMEEASKQGLEHFFFNEELQFLLEAPLGTAVRPSKKGTDTSRIILEDAEVVGVDVDGPGEQSPSLPSLLVTLSRNATLQEVAQPSLVKPKPQEQAIFKPMTTNNYDLRMPITLPRSDISRVLDQSDGKGVPRNLSIGNSRSKSQSKPRPPAVPREGTLTPSRNQNVLSRSTIEDESLVRKVTASSKSLINDSSVLSHSGANLPPAIATSSRKNLGPPRDPEKSKEKYVLAYAPPSSQVDQDLLMYLQQLLEDSQAEEMIRNLNHKIDLFFEEKQLRETETIEWD